MNKNRSLANELPKDWEITNIEEVCLKITDGTHVTPTYIDEGIPFLSVKDVTNGGISFDKCKYISNAEYEILTKRIKPEKGDLLYTKVGTTGLAILIDTDKKFSIFVSLALLKPDNNLIDSEYFEKLLNSPSVYSQSQTKTRGMANRNLVLKDIKSIIIPLPSLAIQRRIVSKLNELITRLVSCPEKSLHIKSVNYGKTKSV